MADPHIIRQMLAQRDTTELLYIWARHDEAEWQPAAFEAIASILQERGVPLPEKGDPQSMFPHERHLKESRDEVARRGYQKRRRLAAMTSLWLGSVVALIPLAALLFVVTLIIPESRWPDKRDSPVMFAILMGIVIGIYVVLWQRATVIVWRILTGKQPPEAKWKG